MPTELIEQVGSLLDSLGPWLGGAVAGLLLTIFANRRKLVTYTVSHDRIGITTNDNVLGSVSVTVGENYNASNLYLSKVVVTNRSLKDIENINLMVYVDPNICHLLTETAVLKGSVAPVVYSDEYRVRVEIQDEDDDELRRSKSDFWKIRREYILPAFNRGTTLEIVYLVDVAHGASPGVYLDSNALGVKIKYKQDPFVATRIWGIHIRHAAYAGILFCLLIAFPLLVLIDPIGWPHVIVAILVGIFCALPGALALKAYNYLRSLIVG